MALWLLMMVEVVVLVVVGFGGVVQKRRQNSVGDILIRALGFNPSGPGICDGYTRQLTVLSIL